MGRSKGNIFQQVYHADDRRARINREVERSVARFRRYFGLIRQKESRQFRSVEWEGLNLLLDQSSMVDHRILQKNDWEPEQRAQMQAAIGQQDNLSDCVFLDVGSYWGLYGIKACQQGVGTVHFFEPDPRNRAQLYAQLFLNGLHSSVEVHPVAASDHDGELSFAKSESFTDGNRGKARLSSQGEAEDFKVRCRSLDSAIDFSDRTIFCKMDVEGAELQALAGMKNILQKNRIFLQVEVFEENITAVRQETEKHGLDFLVRIESDDFYSNFSQDEISKP